MEPLSDGVEVAFTVTTVHDHRTASQVPCARRRRRDGATETMGRLSFETPAATQNIGFSSPSRGNRHRSGCLCSRSLGLAGRIPPFLWHEAGRAGRLKSQPRAGLVWIAGWNVPSPDDCMERVR